MRRAAPLLLLGLLAVAGLAGATIGAVQAPNGTPVSEAVTNTLAAPNYTEDVLQQTSLGSQSAHLVYEAPDRLSGYQESAGRRTYVVIIGTVEYVSETVPSNTPTSKLVFFKQQTVGAQAVDPAHNTLPIYKQATEKGRNGDVTTYRYDRNGQQATLVYTVAGAYVSVFDATILHSGHESITITKVGSSPAVALPAGAAVRG